MERLKRILAVLLAATLLCACTKDIQEAPLQIIDQPAAQNTDHTQKPEQPEEPEPSGQIDEPETDISEDTRCDDAPCVAYYLYTYEHLPANYMTKKEAREKGWSSGPLWKVVEGMCIGGDRFGNNEELLPVIKGVKYYECDIDTLSQNSRGSKRIIYSSDGRVYYTEDHYESFELLYGEE